MKHLNLSFAACGFLGIYHLGAASALIKHGQKLLNTVKVFAGASAGSLVATVLLTAPDKIEESKDFLYAFSEDFRKRFPGVVKPRYDFMKYLREGIEAILPAQAHEIAEKRLYVSITNSKSIENCLVSSFASREELIKRRLITSEKVLHFFIDTTIRTFIKKTVCETNFLGDHEHGESCFLQSKNF
ncbi:hypothetical protein GDO81_006544 [Engystomops pustulosus]|uniref:PNPLA domain-containing protein n=1 Tax=Engystomops pustulosus TaxID=76066 RepID=A0AAV7CYQ8_ENGPU|nr:hypothetical protein GDO81_006544 [Engystomops pustulosus]KAG8589844.1 hypothetical protein GDO81_006544 [Engystomops pustulosus]